MVTGPVVSVSPQPSMMVIPAPRRKCPSSWFSGAPPLTAQAACPPSAARSRA